MRKTMKASTLRGNQWHDDVTVSIAATIVLRNLTTPPNADEDVCVDSSSSQLVPPRRAAPRRAAPRDVRDVKISAAANVGQRSPPKDVKTQPNEYTVASSNRRFSSPSDEGDIRGTAADRRSPLQKELQNGQL